MIETVTKLVDAPQIIPKSIIVLDKQAEVSLGHLGILPSLLEGLDRRF